MHECFIWEEKFSKYRVEAGIWKTLKLRGYKNMVRAKRILIDARLRFPSLRASLRAEEGAKTISTRFELVAVQLLG